jgi:hypothetical protein
MLVWDLLHRNVGLMLSECMLAGMVVMLLMYSSKGWKYCGCNLLDARVAMILICWTGRKYIYMYGSTPWLHCVVKTASEFT